MINFCTNFTFILTPRRTQQLRIYFMNLRLLLILFFLFTGFGSLLFGQKLKSIGNTSVPGLEIRDCSTRSPGSVSFGPIVGQSNDGRPDTIYLCYKDQIFIKNNGDGDFSTGDPNTVTPAAIGFLLYGSPPTINGSTFTDIQGDAVLTNPPPPPGELWYFMDAPNGDMTLYNDGSVNAIFNSGKPFPLYLAPVTFDAYYASGGEYYGQWENGGSCVKVNTAAAFPVVYLNEIKVENFATNNPNSLSGSFNVTGGFPEFSTSSTYTISMVKKGSPGVVANFFGGPFKHGSQVKYAVPAAGTYILTISDGKSCAMTQEIVMPQGNVSISVSSGTVDLNDTICLDFVVKDFKDLLGGEFAIAFNPLELQFINIDIPTGNPLGLSSGGNFGLTDINSGYIVFAWTDANLNKKTLADGTVIFSVCFKAIGRPGTNSKVAIVPKRDGVIEFTDYDGTLFTVKRTDGIVKINNPTKLQVFFNICSTTSNTGSVTFTAYGPDAQYNYDFNNSGAPNFTNAGTPVTFSNLTPGAYPIDIYSVAGVHVMHTVFIQNAPPININGIINNPTCFNSTDGNVQINLQGGVPPYAIEWSNFTFNTNNIRDVGNGLYTVTVTDDIGCIFSQSFTLYTSPISINPPAVTDPACSGQKNGSISISATGGNPKAGNAYDFLWSYQNTSQIGVTTGSLSNIPEGTYFVTVTDNNGCTATSSFVVDPGVVLDATVLKQLPVCFGDGKGKLTVTGTTNGSTTGPYTFTWSPNATSVSSTATSSVASGLNNGNYMVTVEDNNGCFVKKEFVIDGPGEIKFLIANLKDDVCGTQPSGGALIYDGSGNATPFPDPKDPGNGFYRFTWSNGSNPTTVDAVSLNLTNLAGSATGIRYYVTITGADGCIADTSFLIFKKDAPAITFDTLHAVSCAGGSDGSIRANIKANGSDISTVTWSNNAGVPVNGGDPKNLYTSTVSSLNGGQYFVTVVTLSGCIITDTVSLESAGSLLVDNNFIVPATCPDSDDGSITLVVSGGNPPYTYQWNNGQSGDVASKLKPGKYTVTISDQSACPPVIQTFTVDHAPTVASGIDINSIVASDCFESTSGSGGATVQASGGQSNTYTFKWSSGETGNGTSSTATKLKGGWQYVSITDGFCQVIDSVFIPSPDPISAGKQNAVIGDVSCFGLNDGSLSFTASGGNGGYNYSWNPTAANASSLTGLKAGVYYVTITDAKNCIGIDSFKVNQPAELIVSLDPVLTKDIGCNGEETGSIKVNVQGGNGGNTFTWNPAVTGNADQATNLAAGNYLVTVRDRKGCQANISATIKEPTPLSVNFDPVPDPICAGYETNFELNNITGGVGPDYTYTIDHGKAYSTFEIAKVKGGEHILTIIDENGCTLDTTFKVNEPAPILVSLPDELQMNLGDTIRLSPIVQSAFPITNITWSPAGSVSCVTCDFTDASVITSQYITAIATDVNGCTGRDSVYLKVDRSRKVFIPNAFSPNKDGINDIFQVFTGPGVEGINYLRVFDRYGALVYERNNLPPNENGSDLGWDGTYKGKYCDPGVFTYLAEVRFIDGRTQKYFGSVTLIR